MLDMKNWIQSGQIFYHSGQTTDICEIIKIPLEMQSAPTGKKIWFSNVYLLLIAYAVLPNNAE